MNPETKANDNFIQSIADRQTRLLENGLHLRERLSADIKASEGKSSKILAAKTHAELDVIEYGPGGINNQCTTTCSGSLGYPLKVW